MAHSPRWGALAGILRPILSWTVTCPPNPSRPCARDGAAQLGEGVLRTIRKSLKTERTRAERIGRGIRRRPTCSTTMWRNGNKRPRERYPVVTLQEQTAWGSRMRDTCEIRITLATVEEAEKFVSEVWLLLLEKDLPSPVISISSNRDRAVALSLSFRRLADARSVAGRLDEMRYPAMQILIDRVRRAKCG